MQRRTTVLRDDFPSSAAPFFNLMKRTQSISSVVSASQLPTQPDSDTEEYDHDHGAFACVGSSKKYRQGCNPTAVKNEDKVFIENILLQNNSLIALGERGCESALLVGLFDGHGGFGLASKFVCEHMKGTFEQEYAALGDCKDSTQRVTQAFERAFHSIDAKFHDTVNREALKANVVSKNERCTCKFYNENPCMCLKPPIPANEGSTATVVLVTRTHIYVANVGDSDAVLFRCGPAPMAADVPLSDSETDSDSELATCCAGGVDSLADQPELPLEQNLTKRFKSTEDETLLMPTSKDDECTSQATVALDEYRAVVGALDLSKPYVMEVIQLTVTDTPLVDISNEDYRRIRDVVVKRKGMPRSGNPLRYNAHPSTTLVGAPLDGILKSQRGDRFNYVLVEGARSLNMVRAFGNLGNKRFVDNRLEEEDSPIISRPHVFAMERSNQHFAIVVASDGLWDNVERDVVTQIVEKHLVDPAFSASSNGNDYDSASSGSQQQREAVRECANELMGRALRSKKKPDDVSVVVIPLLNGMF